MRVEVTVWTRSSVNERHGLEESILTFDARVLSQVINDHLTRVDVIVDEWHPGFRATPTKNRNSGQAEPSGTYHFFRAIRPEFCFFLLHGHKFRVNGHQHSCSRKLIWVQEIVFNTAAVAIAGKVLQPPIGVVGDVNTQRDITVMAEHRSVHLFGEFAKINLLPCVNSLQVNDGRYLYI